MKALEVIETGQKSPFFKYMSTIFFFGKTKLFKSFFYHNTLPVGFCLILTYIWSISLCKISQLQESEMRPTGWTLSYTDALFGSNEGSVWSRQSSFFARVSLRLEDTETLSFPSQDEEKNSFIKTCWTNEVSVWPIQISV